jgi:effector-binding domain-containing protein
MDYEVTDVPASTYAVIRRTLPFGELPTVVPQLIGQVHEWAHAQAPHGLPMCLSSSAGEGTLNIAPGWEVGADAGDPPAPIELVHTPEQRAAVHVHVGPYDELGRVYPKLYDALTAGGLRPAEEPREIYESPPDDPNPTTRIIWPLVQSS